MADLVNFTGYAKLRGVSLPYISKLVKDKVIPITADRRIDPLAADAAIAAHRNVGKQYTADRHARKRAGKGGVESGSTQADWDESPMARFNRAKADSETYRALTFEMEYRKLKGELVETAAVERAVFENASAGRKGWERLPDRVSARVAAALGVDARACHLLLQAEVREICEEMAKTAEALPDSLTATKQ